MDDSLQRLVLELPHALRGHWGGRGASADRVAQHLHAEIRVGAAVAC